MQCITGPATGDSPKSTTNQSSTPQPGACVFLQSPYDQRVQLLSQEQVTKTNTTPGSSTNVTSSVESSIGLSKALLMAKIFRDWIIDTGATNHWCLVWICLKRLL